jgi:hypothetical protein
MIAQDTGGWHALKAEYYKAETPSSILAGGFDRTMEIVSKIEVNLPASRVDLRQRGWLEQVRDVD